MTLDDVAIERIKMFCPDDGYYLAFSGGKDSICLYHLAKQAGVKFDAHYHLTTVDPPELVRFIRQNYPDVEVIRPKMSMWELIAFKQMPPSRHVRYCCSVLKERGGIGRRVLTGVRWAESSKRAKLRKSVELKANRTGVINPMIDWADSDVWEYIHTNNIPYCSLYDDGFKRLGCIGCPLSGKDNILREFARWPKYKTAYLHAFDRACAIRKSLGKEYKGEWKKWVTGQDMFDSWIEDAKPEDDSCILFT
jgi:phosphoadenosine phosphosulfate reductase